MKKRMAYIIKKPFEIYAASIVYQKEDRTKNLVVQVKKLSLRILTDVGQEDLGGIAILQLVVSLRGL